MNKIFDYLEAFKSWTYENGVVCLIIYALIEKEGH